MTNTACPCDNPPVDLLQIPAGLPVIPRQTQTFPDVRRALLDDVPNQLALQGWKARGERDFGLMWLEMWAYVADVLGFYDERIANETYIRTAARRPSLRRIVAMLGYQPAPGVAGSAVVAAIAEGKTGIVVPAGTAVRSTAFLSPPPEPTNLPPQIFEVTQNTPVHPLKNSWQIGPVAASMTTSNTTISAATAAGGAISELVFETAEFGLAKNRLVLFRVAGADDAGQVSRVTGVTPFQGKDGRTYLRVSLNSTVALPTGVALSDIEVLTPTVSGVAVNASNEPFLPESTTEKRVPISNEVVGDLKFTRVDLDTVYRQLRAKEPVVISGPAGTPQPEEIEAPTGVSVHLADSVLEIGIPVPGAVVSDGTKPPEYPVTVMRLSPVRSGDSGENGFDYPRYTFHFAFVAAGRLTEVADTQPSDVTLTNSVRVTGVVEPPPDAVNGVLEQSFLLRDADDQGAFVEKGRMTFYPDGTATFQVSSGTLPSNMRTPITVFGNVLQTTRGESVFNEVLGNGNAQVPLQSFKLRKKPVTYLPDSSVELTHARSTLQIKVNQVLWTEVSSFLHAGPQDQVYITRVDDQQNTIVTFGDGVNGARLPSGVKNVVATYRFGSGLPAPPAGSIRQLARAVKGLRRVESPIAAAQGKDPDAPDALRTAAPQSVLLFGHLVSAADFQVSASLFPGVVKAVAEFLFIDVIRGAGIVVSYIGSADADKLHESLRLIAEPGLAIDVHQAYALNSKFVASIDVEKHFDKDVVAQNVTKALANGPLATRNAPIGQPLYRSTIFDAIHGVEGVVGIDSASVQLLYRGFVWYSFNFDDSNVTSACWWSDTYFDFGDGQQIEITCVAPASTSAEAGGAT